MSLTQIRPLDGTRANVVGDTSWVFDPVTENNGSTSPKVPGPVKLGAKVVRVAGSPLGVLRTVVRNPWSDTTSVGWLRVVFEPSIVSAGETLPSAVSSKASTLSRLGLATQICSAANDTETGACSPVREPSIVLSGATLPLSLCA